MTSNMESPSTQVQPAESTVPPSEKKSLDERKVLLAQTIQGRVVGGARVESQGDFQAVLITGHKVNHVLHLILSISTLGLWLIVWLILTVIGGEKREIASVDEFGNIMVQKVS